MAFPSLESLPLPVRRREEGAEYGGQTADRPAEAFVARGKQDGEAEGPSEREMLVLVRFGRSPPPPPSI